MKNPKIPNFKKIKFCRKFKICINIINSSTFKDNVQLLYFTQIVVLLSYHPNFFTYTDQKRL